MLTVLIERDNLNWDVPSQRIFLELTQYVPSEHVRQEDVERYGGRLVLLGQIERVIAAHRQQHLKALVTREIDHDARIMRIILHNQQNGVAWLNFKTIVWNLLDRTFHRRNMEPDSLSGRRTTATVIGRVRAKFLIAGFMCVETILVWIYFRDWIIAGFLAIGALWFLIDATLLWRTKAYAPKQMRLFLWGWNAAALLGMFWNWTHGTLTRVFSTAGLPI